MIKGQYTVASQDFRQRLFKNQSVKVFFPKMFTNFHIQNFLSNFLFCFKKFLGTYKDFRCVLAGTKIKWSLQLPSKDIDFKIKKFINGGPLEGEVIHEISRAAYGKIHEGEIDAIDEE